MTTTLTPSQTDAWSYICDTALPLLQNAADDVTLVASVTAQQSQAAKSASDLTVALNAAKAAQTGSTAGVTSTAFKTAVTAALDCLRDIPEMAASAQATQVRHLMGLPPLDPPATGG